MEHCSGQKTQPAGNNKFKKIQAECSDEQLNGPFCHDQKSVCLPGKMNAHHDHEELGAWSFGDTAEDISKRCCKDPGLAVTEHGMDGGDHQYGEAAGEIKGRNAFSHGR